MSNQHILSIVLLSMAWITGGSAGQWCANCYWGSDDCPYISTQEVVETQAYNENKGLSSNDRGPFLRFLCDNGRSKLGVLWTDKTCGQTGGLTLNNSEDYANTDKSKCTFGQSHSAH